MAPILARRVPVDLVILRRLDLPRCCVDVAAIGLSRPGPSPEQMMTECTSEEIERLVAWYREGHVLRADAEKVYDLLPGLLPAGIEG